MRAGIAVSGLDKLDSKLAKIDKSLARKSLEASGRKALLPAYRKAKQLTPQGSNYFKRESDRGFNKMASSKSNRRKLGQSMQSALERKAYKPRIGDKYASKIRLRFNSKKAFYAKFVLSGTSPHKLYKGVRSRINAGFKKVYLYGRWMRLSQINHPGIKGKNILGISFRTSKNGMEKVFANELKKRIEKAAK